MGGRGSGLRVGLGGSGAASWRALLFHAARHENEINDINLGMYEHTLPINIMICIQFSRGLIFTFILES